MIGDLPDFALPSLSLSVLYVVSGNTIYSLSSSGDKLTATQATCFYSTLNLWAEVGIDLLLIGVALIGIVFNYCLDLDG